MNGFAVKLRNYHKKDHYAQFEFEQVKYVAPIFAIIEILWNCSLELYYWGHAIIIISMYNITCCTVIYYL